MSSESSLPRFPSANRAWVETPFRAFARPTKQLVAENWSSSELLSLTKKGVIRRDIDSGDGKYPASFDGYQIVEPGDLVMCLFDVEETPRTVGLARERGMITAAYTRYRLNECLVDSQFIEWLLISLDNEKRFKPFYSGLRNTIPKDVLSATRFDLPPMEEQRRIAEFLDRETAQIDELIAKQEELISTLAERFATQVKLMAGLGSQELADSNTPTLRRVARMATGGTPSGDESLLVEGDSPWFRPDDLDESGRPSVATRFISRKSATALTRVEPGSTLVCAIGSIGKLGFVDVECWTNQQITAVTFAELVLPRFGYYALLAEREQIVALSVGNTLPIINNLRLGATKLAVPSQNKQHHIIKELDEQSRLLRVLTKRVEQAIALLRERRQALISAAVTGQIDVGGASR